MFSAYMAIIMSQFLWCANCYAHLVPILVLSHVCSGVSLSNGPLFLCVACVTVTLSHSESYSMTLSHSNTRATRRLDRLLKTYPVQ
jgi:hypothetical protein